VLGRRMEDFMCRVLLSAAQSEGAVAVIGEYVCTEKNVVVRDLYPRMGFELRPGTGAEYIFFLRDRPILSCEFIGDETQTSSPSSERTR
jgi:predicted enzyme involved in methoxymalonyl-ACP biosynthesis